MPREYKVDLVVRVIELGSGVIKKVHAGFQIQSMTEISIGPRILLFSSQMDVKHIFRIDLNTILLSSLILIFTQ